MESYRYLAEIYDSCMYDVDYGEWYAYIKELLSDHNVTGEVIETACGTGNITQYLARDYDVIAVDSSEEMLETAREKLKKQGLDARFVCCDMAEFERGRKSASVICAMDGVNYLTDSTDEFFKKAYDNLKENGVFLFDISSEYKLSEVIGNDFFCDVSDEASYVWMNEYKDGLLTMDITMFIENGRGLYNRYDEVHRQRAWSIDDIKGSLKRAGFTDIKVYGFLTRESPGKETERIQFAAVREK